MPLIQGKPLHPTWRRSREKLLRAAPILLITALTVFLYRRLFIDALPATGDHLCHLFQGWLIAEKLLPSFRITGFSHMAFAGYPAGMYYPVGGALWIAAVRYITFGALPWEWVYRIALFGVVWLWPVSVYLLTRRAASRTAAGIAAVLALGDMGGWRQGGSIFTLYWGVWPYLLACATTLIAVSMLERPLTEKTTRTLRSMGAAALLSAFAVLSHPISAVFLVAAGPLLVLLTALFSTKQVRPQIVLLRAALLGAAAVGICLFWLVPQITTAQAVTESFGDSWISLEDLPAALFTNRLFDRFSVIALALGLFGTAAGFAAKKLWPLYLSATIVVVLVLASAAGDTLSEKIQFERLSAFVKGFLFAAAGFGIDVLGRIARSVAARGLRGSRTEMLLRASERGKVALGAMLLVVIFAVDWTDHYAKVGEFRPVDQNLWNDIKSAERWLFAQKKHSFDRVLYQPGKVCLSGNRRRRECRRVYDNHIFAAGPIFSGYPKVKFGFEPAATFGNLPLSNHWHADVPFIERFLSDPEAIARLGITWIVSLSPWPDRADLVEAKRFGRVRIYKVRTDLQQPPALLGNPKITVERFEDEQIAIRVHGSPAGTPLVFPVAYHPYWHAEIDGKEAPIEQSGVVPGVREILMTVSAPSNGHLVLTFVRPVSVRIASAISLLLFLLSLAALFEPTLKRTVKHYPCEHCTDASGRHETDGS